MIKLFGMTICSIPNKEEDIVSTTDLTSSHHDHLSSSTTTTTTCINTKDPTQSNNEESSGMDDKEFIVPEGCAPTILSEISQEPETSSGDKESLLPNTIEKDAPNDSSNSDEQTLEKPDKLLPCPRCSSMDTKFCYYNNYNVSQPRHFCKSCQRYWTAGGTMRSVPVGSGRRKNKCSPASRYRQIIVTEALHAVAQACATNGSLLAFGSDSSQCKNMSSATIQTEKPENRVRNKCFEETHDDNSSGSSSTVLNPNEKVFGAKPKLKNIQDSPIQLPCFPVPSWASPWNTAEWRSATQQPSFCPPGFPSSFYPTPPYWGCPEPNPWNMAWLSPHCSSGELSVRSPGSNSQTLGKHSRDESNIGSSNREKPHLGEGDLKRGVLTPKTLRIHDPIEAAQSSIWSTLGIKNEHTKPVNEANLLEDFRAKGVQRYHMTKAAMVLQANPAALHRSYNFLETA